MGWNPAGLLLPLLFSGCHFLSVRHLLTASNLQKYNNLSENNEKNGSFYLQSKVHRAKECLEAAHQSSKVEGTSSWNSIPATLSSSNQALLHCCIQDFAEIRDQIQK